MLPARASRPGRWLGVAAAASLAFLVGNWQALKFRAADLSSSKSELSPSEKVALRFPEAELDQPIKVSAAGTAPMVLGEREIALFSPEPAFFNARPLPAPPQRQPAEITASLPAAEGAPVRAAPLAIPVAAKKEAKPPAANAAAHIAQRVEADATFRHANRPGFLLNDAQIASIKSRLHLTPDQERMWPAVEAALRNIAYAKAQVAHRRGDDRGADLAALDPDGAAVQGLKSAAVPLIMSFSDEQKNEVRSLAHVMGLDKLAAEF
jgi:hypothetical protein